jgi:hypothetical protein
MEIQAGGVKGLDVERSSARTPCATKVLRKGIVPSSIKWSKMVNVAPSIPINIVGFIKLLSSL